MIQPFLTEIAEGGEWSLVFFGGNYSHGVIKKPSAGDFRVQEDFGGSFHSAPPSSAIIEAAKRCIEIAVDRCGASPPLYARVDGIETDGGAFVLLELELIEPGLFFRSNKLAGDRFARALITAASLCE